MNKPPSGGLFISDYRQALARTAMQKAIEVQLRHRQILFAGVVIGLAYLLPNHYPPWPASYQDLLTGIGFTPILLWALWQKGPIPALAVGAFSLSVTPMLQLAVGQVGFAGDAWIAWLYLVGFALAVLAGARLDEAGSDANEGLIELAPLMGGLVLAALVSVGIAMYQWLGLRGLNIFAADFRPGGRPYANLAQPNQLATLYLLGCVGAAFLYESGFLRGVVALAATLMLAFGLAMTESRTTLVALGVVWIAYLAMRRRTGLRMTATALLWPTCLYALISWIWPTLNRALLLPQASSLADRMGENLRLTLWQSMVDAIGRAPWFGYGWNQVSLAQQATALDHPATRYVFESAHNLFLDLALWNGLPIALLVAAGLAVWFCRRIVACRDPSSWCRLLAVTLVFCHAMVEYPLTYAYFLLPVGFLMGTLNSVGSSRRREEGRITLPRPVLASTGLFVLAMFATVVAEYFPLEEQWRQIRFEQLRFEKAQVDALPNIRVLTQLRERATFTRSQASSDMTLAQLEWMRRVAERFGGAGPSFKYAKALALNAQPQAAGLVLSKLCKTQQPWICRSAIEEWRSLSADKYPEMRAVVLPTLPALTK